MSYNFFGGYKAKKFDITEEFSLDGTKVTASAADINKINGLDSLDIANLSDITVDAADINKIDSLDMDNLADITALAADINKLTDAGAVVASGTQASPIDKPTGETGDKDIEARAAIDGIIDALVAFGIIEESS